MVSVFASQIDSKLTKKYREVPEVETASVVDAFENLAACVVRIFGTPCVCVGERVSMELKDEFSGER